MPTTRRAGRVAVAIAAIFAELLTSHAASSADDAGDPPQKRPPNVVIIFIDDLGYADIGPFGATAYRTPNLDRMAREGRIFTDFHAATAVCSASRAALMTGCYPERVSILGALGPLAREGINAEETTLAELCKSRGYATAVFGKWHLGRPKKFLPLQHGFDEYLGLPYSNDMWPRHPELASSPQVGRIKKEGYPELPLIEGNEVVDPVIDDADQDRLTTLYTERTVDFINRNASRPFLLYVPHSMVHVPLHVSDKFRGKSGVGLFGDVMMEVDWSVGQILDAIEKNGIDENTLVIFTADNGPWLNYGNHAGSAGPLREGKGTMWEGGYRVPCVMRWPGQIPADTKCDEFAATIDLFPTIAHLAGAAVPGDRVIDGQDIWPLMSGAANAQSPHEAFWCYYGGELRAVRDRQWKLVFPHEYRSLDGQSGGRDGQPKPYTQLKTGLALYDLKNDVGETTDVALQHPEVVARLNQHGENARQALGDKLTGRQGSEVRPAGMAKQKS